jgi:hypothetical protein
MQHHSRSADLGPDPQRLDQRGDRLVADLGIVGGAVEQVDGVDQDGLDRARLDRVTERREVILAVGRGTPHPRRLIEDLDRLTAALGPAPDRLVEAPSRTDMSAD